MTAYHLLWELVHVFSDRLGPLSDRGNRMTGPADCFRRGVRHLLRRGSADDGDPADGSGTWRSPVRTDSSEEISVALVDSSVGDTVLVHAKEAIAVIRAGNR